jgi:hypothetical protein
VWRIYGIGRSEAGLEQASHHEAARLFGLDPL